MIGLPGLMGQSGPALDDFDLLDAWRSGDRIAGNALLRRHFDSLYCFFNNKTDHDVDDLIQRTFLACVESKERFRKEASFRTYLFTVARNELFGFFKRKQREDVDMGTMSVVDLGSSPTSRAVKLEEERLLLSALQKIPVDLQIAIELHYWEGLSTSELAEVLGVPQGTAKSRTLNPDPTINQAA